MTQLAQPLPQSLYTLETPQQEPLPVYSPPERPFDPETASIHSLAPSYRSEAPPYSPPLSLINSTDRNEDHGLPYQRYASGFHARAHGSVGDIHNHNYNISNWSSVRSGPASKQYENVAKRRASAAVQREDALAGLFSSISPVPAIIMMSSSSSTPVTGTSSPAAQRPVQVATNVPAIVVEQPHNPREDPALVGEIAAARAKEQRLYRETCMRDSREALRYESKSWDFMLSQMRDWEEREQSWNNFRQAVNGGRRKMLAKRLGL